MQQLIVMLFGIAAIFSLYKAFSERNMFFSALAMGFCFGLFALLQVSGIDFLSQVNSSGYLVYEAQTAANNPGVSALAYTFFAFAWIAMYRLLQTLITTEWSMGIINNFRKRN